MSRFLVFLGTVAVLAVTGRADSEEAHFERRIRPVLVEHCFECHSEKKKGGLRLDHPQHVERGGDTGPVVVPGDPEQSLLIQALRYGADSYQMPPDGKLPESVIRDFERWVAEGARWPAEARSPLEPRDEETGFRISDGDRSFWSFQALSDEPAPRLDDDDWSRNAIDQFVLRTLRREGLHPTKPMDRRGLIRRASYDLTGLPPTRAEIERFVADDGADAFPRLVDRLLASPRYGEHSARFWLDGVRYVSDVGYYNFSEHGWRYRDWVIRAFNEDLPYDAFVRLQIAGDLIPNPVGDLPFADGVIATGVLAMGNYDDQESDKEKLYAEVIDDQIDLVGRQFLGLTLACARCHDHKFDPISAADYYALGGIFLSSQVLETKSRIGAHRLKIPVASAETMERYAAAREAIAVLEKELKGLGKPNADHPEQAVLKRRIQVLRSSIPRHGGLAIGARDGGYDNSRHKKIGDMPLYIRGNPYRLGPRIPRRIPVLFGGDQEVPIGRRTQQSGRLELAEWIASNTNPLTARVMVNRIWLQHFGKGLVGTPNNFGKRGERPTHPKLLDFLAHQFVSSGWSVKHVHRLIMTSATYQQASGASHEGLERDPGNQFYGRFVPRRLRAEELADSLLMVSGQLRQALGQGQGNRAVYRRVGHLYSDLISSLFDAPPTGTMLAQRTESTTAPQSLFMMNDRSVVEASRRIANQLAAAGMADQEQIELAYQVLFGRQPETFEVSAGLEFLRQQPAGRRWTYIQVLLCSNEFMYVD